MDADQEPSGENGKATAYWYSRFSQHIYIYINRYLSINVPMAIISVGYRPLTVLYSQNPLRSLANTTILLDCGMVLDVKGRDHIDCIARASQIFT